MEPRITVHTTVRLFSAPPRRPDPAYRGWRSKPCRVDGVAWQSLGAIDVGFLRTGRFYPGFSCVSCTPRHLSSGLSFVERLSDYPPV